MLPFPLASPYHSSSSFHGRAEQRPKSRHASDLKKGSGGDVPTASPTKKLWENSWNSDVPLTYPAVNRESLLILREHISKKTTVFGNPGPMVKSDELSVINSFGVKAVYIRLFRTPIRLAEQRAPPRALEVACSSPGVSVILILHFFCFRARLARKCERSDPRVDLYNTPSYITMVNSLNL